MTAASKLRWLSPTPAWLVYGAAAATGVLFACERWRWFPVGYQKGWPVVLAVAVVGAVLVLTLAWMLVALVFRRRAQFGLRTLLVFVTLCAVVCSWLAVRIKQARRQAEVVAAVDVKINSVVPLNVFIRLLSHVRPRAPQPLRNLLGGDFFGDIELLELNGRVLTDTTFAQLQEFTRLKELLLYGDDVTDAGLSHLEGWTKLRNLDLVDTKVTDEGVKKLQRALPQCKIEVYEARE